MSTLNDIADWYIGLYKSDSVTAYILFLFLSAIVMNAIGFVLWNLNIAVKALGRTRLGRWFIVKIRPRATAFGHKVARITRAVARPVVLMAVWTARLAKWAGLAVIDVYRLQFGPFTLEQLTKRRGAVIALSYSVFALTVPNLLLRAVGSEVTLSLTLLSLAFLALTNMQMPGLVRTVDWSSGYAVTTYAIKPLRVVLRQLSFIVGASVMAFTFSVMFYDYRPPAGEAPQQMLLTVLPLVAMLLIPIVILLVMIRFVQAEVRAFVAPRSGEHKYDLA